MYIYILLSNLKLRNIIGWVVITRLAGRGFHRSVVFVEFLWNIFIILLWFLYQRVRNGLGCVLVCVLYIAAPGLQNYLPLFVSSCYHELSHTLCAIVGGYPARCPARTTTGNVELCSQLSGRWGLPLHPTPWVRMYRPSWPVLHQRSALVLSGSASRSLLDLLAPTSQNSASDIVFPVNVRAEAVGGSREG